jgi:hypothetical protein
MLDGFIRSNEPASNGGGPQRPDSVKVGRVIGGPYRSAVFRKSIPELIKKNRKSGE